MNGYFDLRAALAPVWQGNCIQNESLLFTPDPISGEIRPCRLLCRPEKLLRVCSADFRTEYLPEVDYRLEDGCIVRLPGSRMPCFSYDEYFLPQAAEIPIASVSCPGRFVRYEPNGAAVLQRQVCVSYLYSGDCPIQPPPSQLPLLPHTAQTLREGRPLTVLFYGDSFMEGCDASGRTGLAPYLPPLDWLVTMALADAYRHPSIRRINTAVGGTTSRWGLEQAKDRLAAYAPELAVIRFGMNDSGAGIEPEEYIRNLRGILAAGRQANAQMEFLLLASETPNPDCEGWTRFQRAYEQPLRELVRETPGCGFVSIAAPFDAASAAKGYPSLSANLVNHPNDFMIRVYAASIVQALLDAGTELVQ